MTVKGELIAVVASPCPESTINHIPLTLFAKQLRYYQEARQPMDHRHRTRRALARWLARCSTQWPLKAFWTVLPPRPDRWSWQTL